MRQNTVTARLTLPVSKRDHILGPETAAVTLVEYGDYECPYCGQAHPIVKELLRRLRDQLRFAYRHFPLTQVHPHAEQAAQAAEAAGKVTPHQGGRADSVGVSSRALAAARDAGLTGFAAEGAGSGEALHACAGERGATSGGGGDVSVVRHGDCSLA